MTIAFLSSTTKKTLTLVPISPSAPGRWAPASLPFLFLLSSAGPSPGWLPLPGAYPSFLPPCPSSCLPVWADSPSLPSRKPFSVQSSCPVTPGSSVSSSLAVAHGTLSWCQDWSRHRWCSSEGTQVLPSWSLRSSGERDHHGAPAFTMLCNHSLFRVCAFSYQTGLSAHACCLPLNVQWPLSTRWPLTSQSAWKWEAPSLSLIW